MKKHIANLITSFRVILSVIMIFFSVLSFWFWALYLLCGISDMIDGTIARKTNNANEFGGKLDTIADFIFITVSFIKITPKLYIPIWLWGWIFIIAIIRIYNIISGYILNKNCYE